MYIFFLPFLPFGHYEGTNVLSLSPRDKVRLYSYAYVRPLRYVSVEIPSLVMDSVIGAKDVSACII
jgi:hypothetical protein